MQRLLGVNTKESRLIYRLFQDRITLPENTIRWNWQPGDLAIWDNRATQHYAVADYGTQRRRMHRITLAGDIPIGVTGERSHIICGDASEYSVITDPTKPSPDTTAILPISPGRPKILGNSGFHGGYAAPDSPANLMTDKRYGNR